MVRVLFPGLLLLASCFLGVSSLADTRVTDIISRSVPRNDLAPVVQWPADTLPSLAQSHDRRPMARPIANTAILVSQNQFRDLEEALRLREQQEAERRQLEQRDKEAEEQRKKEEEARLEREEARLAPICEPLKNRVLSLLQNTGTARQPFEQARKTLREIDKRLPGSCPQRVKLFDSSVDTISPCRVNNAVFVKLTDGEQYILTKDTRTFGHGLPQKAGEWIIGITDNPYYCIISDSPLMVRPGWHINALVRRK